jgi:hypothetical protein
MSRELAEAGAMLAHMAFVFDDRYGLLFILAMEKNVRAGCCDDKDNGGP